MFMSIYNEPINSITNGAGTRLVQVLDIGRPQEAQGAEMPNARRSSEFSLVQEEAKNRLRQVYSSPVLEVTEEIAERCVGATMAIDHAAKADGPMDLALNESNVRGM